MLKFIKSKSLLGLMVLAVMFLGAFALKTTAFAAEQPSVTVADIQYTATVQMGSSGQASLIWQRFLNGYSTTAQLVEDGKFGPLSVVQAKAWQGSRGLSADGVLGGLSRASAMAQITSGSPASAFPVGCTSATGFSTATGLPCTTLTTLPAGCSSTTGFSPSTGVACSTTATVTFPAGCSSAAGFSSTTGASCATGAVVNNGPLLGSAGSIDVVETSTDVETVAIEGQATKMLGFKVEASDSDVSITNLKVTLTNTNAPTSPYRLTNYVDSVDIYMGSTKVGSALASDFTKSSYTYTKSIALSNAVVRMGANHKATFYVVLNVASSIDTANMVGGTAGHLAQLDISVDNIRYQDATGVIMTDNPVPALAVTAPATGSFDSITGAGDVKLTISKGSMPVEGTVEVSDSGSTSDILMNQFKLKATGSDLSFDQISFAIDPTSTLGTVDKMIQGLELRKGTDVLASDPIFYDDGADNIACNSDDVISAVVANIACVKFTLDDTYTISQDSTDTFGVYAKIGDITDFTAGSLKVDLAVGGIATEASNGAIVTNEAGSAVGTIQTFSATGAVVGTYSWTVNSTGTMVDFFFTVDNSAGDSNFVLATLDVNDAIAAGSTANNVVAAPGANATDIGGTVSSYSGDVAANNGGLTTFTVAPGDTTVFRVRYSVAVGGVAAVVANNGKWVEFKVNSIGTETVPSTKVQSPTATVNL